MLEKGARCPSQESEPHCRPFRSHFLLTFGPRHKIIHKCTVAFFHYCKIWHSHHLSTKMMISLQNTYEKINLWCKECTDLEFQCIKNRFVAGLLPDPPGSFQYSSYLLAVLQWVAWKGEESKGREGKEGWRRRGKERTGGEVAHHKKWVKWVMTPL